MRNVGTIEPAAYGRAFVLLARNPSLVLGPLLMGVAGAVLRLVFGIPTFGGYGLMGQVNGGIVQLIVQVLTGFGLGIALLGADTAWRRGRAPFEEAWEEFRRKAGDIALAVLGLYFVIFVATLAGRIIPLFGSAVLALVALFFFIYAIPAAAIGGIPGGASLQISLERAQRNPLPTAAVTVLFVAITFFLQPFIEPRLALLVLTLIPTLPLTATVYVISAIVQAVCTAYLALVLAKTYADISYGRRY